MRQRGLRQRFFIDRHGSSARSSIGYWLRLIPNLSDQLCGADFGQIERLETADTLGENLVCPQLPPIQATKNGGSKWAW